VNRKAAEVARWAVTWEPWGKKPRREFFATEKKARAFYKKLFRSSPASQGIEELPAPLVLGRRRMIGGVQFRSDGTGHWFSEDMKYAAFHMLRGTAWDQWELYRRGKTESGTWGDCLELLETGFALADFKSAFAVKKKG
jgi:hypothetical protein